jgi:hypothetical protein
LLRNLKSQVETSSRNVKLTSKSTAVDRSPEPNFTSRANNILSNQCLGASESNSLVNTKLNSSTHNGTSTAPSKVQAVPGVMKITNPLFSSPPSLLNPPDVKKESSIPIINPVFQQNNPLLGKSPSNMIIGSSSNKNPLFGNNLILLKPLGDLNTSSNNNPLIKPVNPLFGPSSQPINPLFTMSSKPTSQPNNVLSDTSTKPMNPICSPSLMSLLPNANNLGPSTISLRNLSIRESSRSQSESEGTTTVPLGQENTEPSCRTDMQSRGDEMRRNLEFSKSERDEALICTNPSIFGKRMMNKNNVTIRRSCRFGKDPYFCTVWSLLLRKLPNKVFKFDTPSPDKLVGTGIGPGMTAEVEKVVIVDASEVEKVVIEVPIEEMERKEFPAAPKPKPVKLKKSKGGSKKRNPRSKK